LKQLNYFRLLPHLFFFLFIQGCAITHHHAQKSTIGTISNSHEMEAHLSETGPIELETIVSTNWSVSLSGLLNLDSSKAKAAGLKDRDEPIQIYAHLIKHPTRGYYLVDSGVSQHLIQDPSHSGISWVVRKYMQTDKMQITKSTEDILASINNLESTRAGDTANSTPLIAPSWLSGVFLTHLHIDHISGMPAIPNGTPIYIGPTESTKRNFMNLFVADTTDKLLEGKGPLLEWNFRAESSTSHPADDLSNSNNTTSDNSNKFSEFSGVIDIFDDGTVYAISVPGHTPGSTAYLVRTTKGPVLLTGDTSHTRWGWDNEVEPGSFTTDQKANLDSLKRLKALVARHPEITVRLGHQR
jgi:glyoxylase-like metal-dependent hydrolase (beta-lactamase superfamily II)